MIDPFRCAEMNRKILRLIVRWSSENVTIYMVGDIGVSPSPLDASYSSGPPQLPHSRESREVGKTVEKRKFDRK